MPALPNFFLVGAPKAGSTALYFYLDQHPRIYMSPIKEPHFLADEIRYENFSEEMQQVAALGLPALREYLNGPMDAKFSGGPVENWDDYMKLFQGVKDENAIGEASPCYLWSPSAPGNIAARFPDARILMVLRNPVERAFSQYRHMLMFAKKPVSFRQHIEAGLRWSGTRVGAHYPFLRFGLYSEQVARYLTLFPPEKVGIYFYEDFAANAAAILRKMFVFLSVNPDFAPDFSKRHMEAFVPRSYTLKRLAKSSSVWNHLWTRTPPQMRSVIRKIAFRRRGAFVMERQDRAMLIEYYREDVERLASMVGRDLSGWLR